MKWTKLVKASDWKVDKINETDWVIKSPDGTYKNSDGKDYHFKTKEDALEELDYLRAENKFDKKAKSSYGDYLGALDDDAVGNYNIYQDYYGEIFITKHKFNKNYDLMNTADTFEQAMDIIQNDWEEHATAIIYDEELLPEWEKWYGFEIELDPDIEEESLENYGFYDLTDKYAENFDKTANENDTLWLVSSDGSIEIEAPKQLVLNVATSGDNSTAVKELKNAIKKDLSKYSDDVIKSVLNQYAIDGVSEMKREELEDYLVWTLAWDAVELESFDKSSSIKRKSAKENVDGVSVTVYDHGKSGKAYSVEGLTYDECDKVYTELQNMYDIVDTKNMQQDEMKDKCHGYILCKNTITASKEVKAENNCKEKIIKELDFVINRINQEKEDIRNNLTEKECEYWCDYILDSHSTANGDLVKFLDEIHKMTNTYDLYTHSWDYYDQGNF